LRPGFLPWRDLQRHDKLALESYFTLPMVKPPTIHFCRNR